MYSLMVWYGKSRLMWSRSVLSAAYCDQTSYLFQILPNNNKCLALVYFSSPWENILILCQEFEFYYFKLQIILN